MSANSSPPSIKFFIREICRSALLVLAGFAISPTHLLYSFYETHALFRDIAISVGVFTTIFGLFYMLRVSLNVIDANIRLTQDFKALGETSDI
jgi:cytochrome c biogenesis protein CcdA